jgi:predicted MFS family arabinose efflux permease
MLTVMLLPAGILIDRFPIRKILLTSLAISILGTALFSISKSFHVAFSCRILSGIGGSFAFLVCLRVAANLFQPKHLSMAIAFITTFAFLGAIFSQAPLTWLVLQIGWRPSMHVIVAIGMWIWLMNFIYTKGLPTKTHPKSSTSLLAIIPSIKKAACQSQTWLGGLYVSLMNMPTVILGASWGILYLQQVHHLSAMHASYITSFLFAGLLLGSPFMGWVFTIFSNKKTLIVGSAFVLFLCSFLLFFRKSYSTTELSVIFFILGFFSGSQCFGYTVVVDNNPTEVTATASSFSSMVIMIVSALSKVSFGGILNLGWNGLIVDKIPVYSEHSFMLAMIFLPVAFFLSIVIGIFVNIKDPNSIR